MQLTNVASAAPITTTDVGSSLLETARKPRIKNNIPAPDLIPLFLCIQHIRINPTVGLMKWITSCWPTVRRGVDSLGVGSGCHQTEGLTKRGRLSWASWAAPTCTRTLVRMRPGYEPGHLFEIDPANAHLFAG